MNDDEVGHPEDVPLFPILRGESVGENGELSGHAVLVFRPEQLNREWGPDDIAVLNKDLEDHFRDNPGDLDSLLAQVRGVIAEFGEPVGDLASLAYVREVICITKTRDATFVLEDDMHIRLVANENTGEVFFID